MKRFIVLGLTLAAALALGAPVIAADGAAVYNAKCMACHGQNGIGSAMAPAFKGNAFIKDSKEADIASVIKDGREGAAKKYMQFAIGMPKQTLDDDEIKSVIAVLKGWAAQ